MVRLEGQRQGELFGADRSYGSGVVNLATGSVMLTLGALPDVDTSILFSWATPVNYTNRSNQPISISKSAWQLPHTGITPKSLILTWGAGLTANDAVGMGGSGATSPAPSITPRASSTWSTSPCRRWARSTWPSTSTANR